MPLLRRERPYQQESLCLCTLSQHSTITVKWLSRVDFNCPDIDWENLAVRNSAQDKDVR
ncbi:hypothetical protein DPMN_109905 [Dreissena polymorpha]|uniref:Uncharacterized protein n=1 Tax=Dreissena polymorpha TaxID=45954 RepID=A0A9D4QMG8_DREPO|nr:hypothetical protein DPMN_109905 [Dreissena polymorpha]